MSNQINKDYLVATIGAMLRQEQVPPLPEGLDLKSFYEFAKFHCVENIVYHALEQLNLEDQDGVLAKWQQNRDGNIFKLMTQLGELENISAKMEEMGVAHIPLKGPFMLDYYPQFDYRYMGDIDLIVKKEDIKRVSEFMNEQGYQPKDFDLALYHQEYMKKLNGFSMNVEIHDDIMPYDSPYYPIMKDYWSWVDLAPNHHYRYQMPLEQFYLHILTHLAKHYYEEGTGIRSVMDIYVLNNALADKLDEDFIASQLDSVGLLEFRQQVERLALDWFEGHDLSPELTDMANYFLEQGAFGSYETRIDNLVAKGESQGSRVKYILSRIFHDRKRMEQRYPKLKKYPFLLPFYWLYRPIESVANPKLRQKVQVEFDRLKKFGKH